VQVGLRGNSCGCMLLCAISLCWYSLLAHVCMRVCCVCIGGWKSGEAGRKAWEQCVIDVMAGRRVIDVMAGRQACD
jgi:hypothetical protein